MKKENKNKLISIIIVIIMLIASYSIYTKMNVDNRKNDDKKYFEEEEIENIVNSELVEKVIELQKENKDIKGWIRIGNTAVNYPLLQGEDNDYYLSHNYKKESDRWGSIFIHKDSNLNNINSNVIIYGHSSEDSSETDIFSTLLLYKDKSYYDSNKVITIVTDKEEREYTIFSVFNSRVFYKDEVDVFRFYNYLDLSNEDIFYEYIDNVKKSELYDTGLTVDYKNQIITLITCEYSVENGRMVIVAKRTK